MVFEAAGGVDEERRLEECRQVTEALSHGAFWQGVLVKLYWPPSMKSLKRSAGRSRWLSQGAVWQ